MRHWGVQICVPSVGQRAIPNLPPRLMHDCPWKCCVGMSSCVQCACPDVHAQELVFYILAACDGARHRAKESSGLHRSIPLGAACGQRGHPTKPSCAQSCAGPASSSRGCAVWGPMRPARARACIILVVLCSCSNVCWRTGLRRTTGTVGHDTAQPLAQCLGARTQPDLYTS